MRTAVLVVAVLLLAACGSPKLTAPNTSRVRVDTPQLRALKQQAGIEPCANGSGHGPLPKVTVKCLGGGQSVDLSTLRGPLLLNFWYAACPPCRKEMPALAQFHRTHPDVPIIGVDETDTQPQQALQLAQRSGVTYPLIADPGGELQGTKLAVRGFPTTFFVDAQGKVTRLTQAMNSAAEVEAMAGKYL